MEFDVRDGTEDTQPMPMITFLKSREQLKTSHFDKDPNKPDNMKIKKQLYLENSIQPLQSQPSMSKDTQHPEFLKKYLSF